MPLEPTFNYIDDLDQNNPNSSPDTLAQADDHLRGTKKAVKGSFPNLGQVAVTLTALKINDLATKTGTETLDAKTINSGAYTGTQTGFAGNITGNVTGNCTGSSGSTTGNAATATTAVNVSGSQVVNFATTMTKPSNAGSWSANSTPFTIPAGIYNVSFTPPGGFAAYVEIFSNGVWDAILLETTAKAWSQVISDGANVRVRTNNATAVTFFYERLYS